MLYKTKTLKGYKLNSLDGEIGNVQEFYFDDWHWVARYLVANTGTWLIDRQVLISPHALETVIAEEQHIEVKLTKKQFPANSRSLTTDIMDGRCIGPDLTNGAVPPTRCVSVNNGRNPTKARKRGILVCAALTM